MAPLEWFVRDAATTSPARGLAGSRARHGFWPSGLGARTLLGVLVVATVMIAGTMAVLQIRGRELMRAETHRLIEQMGNNAVSGLMVRATEISALSKSVATVASELPHQATAFEKTLPPMLDFGGDLAVAGGGFWPEPFAFDPKLERRSFFWGRNTRNALEYFDDYNQPGPGYHHEEWYVPARYMSSHSCYWSQSYMDPYSYQPMVTCTWPQRDGHVFRGVTTIDLRLEGLAGFVESWRAKTGGYVFIVDRNNKFITYPWADHVRTIGQDEKGKRTEDLLTADQFAARQTLFAPMARALDDLNDETIAAASTRLGAQLEHIAHEIDQDSYQIDAEQARLIAAITIDPLHERFSIERSTLFRTVTLARDPELGEKALAYVFHVPDTYWKLVVVKPFDEASAFADGIAMTLLRYLLLFGLIVCAVAYALFRRTVIQPLQHVTGVMREIGGKIDRQQYADAGRLRLSLDRDDELGELGHSFDELVERVVGNEAQLAEVNGKLEQRVRERTAELVESAERYRALMENTSAVPWEVRPDTLELLHIAPQVDRIFGADTRALLQGTALCLRLVPEEREHVVAALRELSAAPSGTEITLQFRVRVREGHKIHVRTSAWITGGQDGTPRRLLGIASDVSAQKAMEMELAQAQKLESVGRLAAGIAHEINTPVQYVSDNVEFLRTATGRLFALLEKQAATTNAVIEGQPATAAAELAKQAEQKARLPYLTENVPAAIDAALEGLGRVSEIVRSMKSFAHPDQGELEQIDLNAAVSSTLIVARNEYKYVADLDTQFGEVPPVACYPGELNQVVLNLVVNAAHAIGEKVGASQQRGRISVRTRAEDDWAVIEIADTGGGIPETVRERIFDPFFTTKPVGKGTGQGLAIARSVIVDKHKGQLHFETEVGVGTTFTLRIPLRGPGGKVEEAA